ncbi:hypothetical protein AB0N89_25360 [Amycolatopsis sp. NPDC089917]|uniref:hypothetical protein n=1 Tax=Amycolatopsis sp. NPDC089917 TaxID=3155187 RepID=UPI0034427B11
MTESHAHRFGIQDKFPRTHRAHRIHFLFASTLLLTLALVLRADPAIISLTSALLAVAILNRSIRRLKTAERRLLKALADELGPEPTSPVTKDFPDG